jgi:hypothetical protein
MCALEDSISDLAAVDAPSRVLMTLGFAAYVFGGGTSAWPLRQVIGKPAVFALGLNAALTLGVMLTPSGRSPDTDILHAFFAVLADFSLALVGQLGAVALRRRGFMLPPSPRNGGRGSVIGHAEETGLSPSCRCRHSRRRCSHSRSCVRSLRGPDR